MSFDWKRINWLRVVNTIIIVVFIFLTLFFVRFQQVSWNDGSRFATIQNLVENHSFQIDHSLFFTYDKVFISGHFYSDKPPVFSVIASIPYFVLHSLGYYFVDHPRSFVFVTNVLILFIPALFFIYFIFKLFKDRLELTFDKALWLSLILFLSSALWPFTTALNNHLLAALLVGVATSLLFFEPKQIFHYFTIGILFGIATIVDLGSIFIAFSFSLFILFYNSFNKETFKKFIFFCLGIFLFLAVHYIINFQITGDFFPASMHPEFFIYFGSKFSDSNLTSVGLAVHSFHDWIKYVFLMTFGQRGFWFHNPLSFFGLCLAVYYIFQTDKKIRLYSLFSLLSVLIVLMYYSLYGQEAGGGSYIVRWFLILIPIFFPILATWIKQYKSKQWVIIGLATISLMINFWAVGNIMGSANHPTNYSVVNMYKAFPSYVINQQNIWQELLKIK